jgi:hypothetical protein
MSRVKIAVLGISLLTMVFALVGARAEKITARSSAEVRNVSVNWHPQSGEGDVPGAIARLVRNDNNVNASFHANDLIPGNVYTLWWIVVNNPENCLAFPCTAAEVLGNTEALQADVTYAGGIGIVAGEGGMGTLTGHLSKGELSNSWFGNDFQDTRGAELHLVVNDHGPKIPDQLGDMLHTYRGGCTDESLPPSFPATAKSDGIPGPNTCKLFQSAIFQPQK